MSLRRSSSLFSLILRISPIFLILTISSNCVHCQLTSQFFADDGYGQSVAYTFLRESQRKNLQEDILDAFGLDHRPHPKYHEKDDAAPKFLIHLYQNILDEDSGLVKKEIDMQLQSTQHLQFGDESLSINSLRAINSSDKIISFSTTSASQGQKSRHRSLMFDVSDVNPDDRLMTAELRIFRDVSQSAYPTNLTYVVTVYQVSRQQEIRGDYVRKERTLKKLQSRKMTINDHGWIVFDVSQAVNKWLNDTNLNRGLVIRVRSSDFGMLTRI